MPLQTLRFFDFSGGLNDTVPSHVLPPNSAQTARNWNFIRGGALQKRSGSSKLNSSAFNSGAAFTALDQFRPANGNLYLVGIAGNKIAKMDDMDGEWTDITGGLTITAADDNVFTVTQMNDAKILANGINPTIAVGNTGTAAALAGSPPTARSVLHVNRHLCHGRDTTNRRRVQFSDLGDHESYTSTHFIDFSTEVMALGNIFNNLYVFELYETTIVPIIAWPFSTDVALQGVGCVGPRAITNVGGTHLVFMSASGVIYAFDGSSLTDISSGRIDSEINGMNKNRLKNIVMENYSSKNRKQIWISYSAGAATQHDKLLIYDYQNGIANGSWMLFTGIAANVLKAVIEQRSTGQGDISILTGDYDGFVRQQDTSATDDEATNGEIDAFWETGWFDLGALEVLKNTRFAELMADEASDSTVDFSVGFDGQVAFQLTKNISLPGTGGAFGTAIFGQSIFGGGTFPARFLQIPGIGKLVKFGIRSNRPSELLNVLRGFTVRYEVLNERVQVAV